MKIDVIKFKILRYFLKTKKFIDNLTIEHVIAYLKYFAFSLLVILVFIIIWQVFTGNSEKIIGLIGALSILISALLASYSVMLNIDTTIKMKNREHSNLVRNVFFQLCLLKMRLIILDNEKIREKITYNDIDRIFDTFEDIHTLLTEIQTKDIVSISHNNVLSDIHFVYLEFTTLHTHMKAMRKNLIRPNVVKKNEAVFPNPMKKINFRLNIAIDRLTSTLTYLRDGYNKDFKQGSGGIEACADLDINKLKKPHNIIKK